MRQERRQTQRYESDRGVQCWKLSDTVPRWGKLKDIGLGGCYVNTTVPFPEATGVRLQLMLLGKKVSAEGIVRTSTPGQGMGVEFTSVGKEDAARLRAGLEQLCKPGQTPPVLNVQELVLKRIQDWFSVHENLPRETFFQLSKL